MMLTTTSNNNQTVTLGLQLVEFLIMQSLP